MEIKATLNKPYEDSEWMGFIVTQNHHNGYEIRETETALEAWGHTEEEQSRINLESQVAQLEATTGLIRPMRENILAEGSAYSNYIKQKAQEIEDLAQGLRN